MPRAVTSIVRHSFIILLGVCCVALAASTAHAGAFGGAAGQQNQSTGTQSQGSQSQSGMAGQGQGLKNENQQEMQALKCNYKDLEAKQKAAVEKAMGGTKGDYNNQPGGTTPEMGADAGPLLCSNGCTCLPDNSCKCESTAKTPPASTPPASGGSTGSGGSGSTAGQGTTGGTGGTPPPGGGTQAGGSGTSSGSGGTQSGGSQQSGGGGFGGITDAQQKAGEDAAKAGQSMGNMGKSLGAGWGQGGGQPQGGASGASGTSGTGGGSAPAGTKTASVPHGGTTTPPSSGTAPAAAPVTTPAATAAASADAPAAPPVIIPPTKKTVTPPAQAPTTSMPADSDTHATDAHPEADHPETGTTDDHPPSSASPPPPAPAAQKSAATPAQQTQVDAHPPSTATAPAQSGDAHPPAEVPHATSSHDTGSASQETGVLDAIAGTLGKVWDAVTGTDKPADHPAGTAAPTPDTAHPTSTPAAQDTHATAAHPEADHSETGAIDDHLPSSSVDAHPPSTATAPAPSGDAHPPAEMPHATAPAAPPADTHATTPVVAEVPVSAAPTPEPVAPVITPPAVPTPPAETATSYAAASEPNTTSETSHTEAPVAEAPAQTASHADVIPEATTPDVPVVSAPPAPLAEAPHTTPTQDTGVLGDITGALGKLWDTMTGTDTPAEAPTPQPDTTDTAHPVAEETVPHATPAAPAQEPVVVTAPPADDHASAVPQAVSESTDSADHPPVAPTAPPVTEAPIVEAPPVVAATPEPAAVTPSAAIVDPVKAAEEQQTAAVPDAPTAVASAPLPVSTPDAPDAHAPVSAAPPAAAEVPADGTVATGTSQPQSGTVEEPPQQKMPDGMADAFGEMAKSMGFGGESSGKTGIQVTHTTDEYPVNPANGTCTLREAVQAANSDQPVDACPAGSGEDTILLDTPGFYVLKDELLVYSEMTISGILDTAIDTLTEQPKRTTIMRAMGSAATHRLFGVGPKGKLTLNRIAVANGKSDFGGGILVEEGELIAHDTVVAQNTATASGGGIAVSNGKLTLTGCTIYKNNSLSSGGGILAMDSRVRISKSRIVQNSVTQSGGKQALFGAGINSSATPLYIEESTIEGNTFVAASIPGHGAGLHLSNPSLQGALATVINSTIRNNAGATDGGGIMAGFGARLNVVRSALTGNACTGKGGGIHLGDQAELTAANSTIAQNKAGAGGGIHISPATTTLSLRNNTVAENQDTDAFGGGGLNAPPEKKIPGIIEGNVLVGNTAGGVTRDCKGFFASNGANLIGTRPAICTVSAQASDQFGGSGDTAPIAAASVLAPIVHADTPGQTHYPVALAGTALPSVPKVLGMSPCQVFSLCLEEETSTVGGIVQKKCLQETKPLLQDQIGKGRATCTASSIEGEAGTAVAAKPADTSPPSAPSVPLPPAGTATSSLPPAHDTAAGNKTLGGGDTIAGATASGAVAAGTGQSASPASVTKESTAAAPEVPVVSAPVEPTAPSVDVPVISAPTTAGAQDTHAVSTAPAPTDATHDAAPSVAATDTATATAPAIAPHDTPADSTAAAKSGASDTTTTGTSQPQTECNMTWVPTGAGLVYMPDPSCTAQSGSTATPPPPSAPAPSAPVASAEPAEPAPVAEDTAPEPSGGVLDGLLKTLGLRDEEPPAAPTAPAAPPADTHAAAESVTAPPVTEAPMVEAPPVAAVAPEPAPVAPPAAIVDPVRAAEEQQTAAFAAALEQQMAAVPDAPAAVASATDCPGIWTPTGIGLVKMPDPNCQPQSGSTEHAATAPTPASAPASEPAPTDAHATAPVVPEVPMSAAPPVVAVAPEPAPAAETPSILAQAIPRSEMPASVPPPPPQSGIDEFNQLSDAEKKQTMESMTKAMGGAKPPAEAPPATETPVTEQRAVQTAEEEESVAFVGDAAGVPVMGAPGDSLRDASPAPTADAPVAIAALPAPALPAETTERLIAAADAGTIDHQTTAPHQAATPRDSGMPAAALPSTPMPALPDRPGDTGSKATAPTTPSADEPIVTLGESLPASVREQIEAGRAAPVLRREDTAGTSGDASASTDATPEMRAEPATERTDTTVADAGRTATASRDTAGTARTSGGVDAPAERAREDGADASATATGDCRTTLFARDRAPGILLAGMRELMGIVPVISTRKRDAETAQPPAADGAVTETAAGDTSQDTRSADSSAPAEGATPRTDAGARQLPPMEVYLFGRDGSRVTAQRVTTRQSETDTARAGANAEHPLIAEECTVTGGDGLRAVQTREDGTVWGHTAQQYVRLSTRDADAAATDDRAAAATTTQECVIEVAAIPSSGTACDGTRKVEGIAGESPVIGLSSCSPAAKPGATPGAPVTLSFDLFDPAKPESGAGYANLITLPKGLQNVQASILNHLVSDDRVRVQVAVASGSRASPDAHHYDCSLPLGTTGGKPAVCTEAQASDIGAVLTDFTARMDTGEEEPSDIRFLFTDRGQLCGTRVADDTAEQTMDCIEVAGLPERVEAVAGASLERNVDGKRSRTNLLIGTRDGIRLARLQKGEAGLLDPAKEAITMGCAQWREAPGAGTRFRNYRAVPVNLDRAGADDLIVLSEAVDAEGQGAAGVGLMLLPNLNEPATVELKAEGSENPGPEGQPVTEYSFTSEVSDPTDDEVEKVTWEAVDATGKTVALNETETGAVLTDAGQTLAYPVTVKATACDAAGACSTTTATVPGTGLGVDVAPPPPPIEDVAMVTEAGATNVATGGTSSDAGKTGGTEAGGESPAAPADGGGGGCSLILK